MRRDERRLQSAPLTVACDFESDCGTLGGDATRVSGYHGGYLMLTPSQKSQNGRVSFGQISVIGYVEVTMRMYVSSAGGADGVGIVVGDVRVVLRVQRSAASSSVAA